MRTRFAGLMMVLGAVLTIITGCGGGGYGGGALYPTAYGQGNLCYYNYNISEAYALINEDYCPPGSVPYPMPLGWYESNFSFYSSSAYAYMAGYRNGAQRAYLSRSQQFGNTYHTQIINAEKSTVYVDSKGNHVSASKASTSSFTTAKPPSSVKMSQVKTNSGSTVQRTTVTNRAPDAVSRVSSGRSSGYSSSSRSSSSRGR